VKESSIISIPVTETKIKTLIVRGTCNVRKKKLYFVTSMIIENLCIR
jgi:hypothetical protein